MKCPRRSETYGAFQYDEEDNFIKGRCSYCGSVPSAVLFKAIAEQVEIIPTDKSYKVYISNGNHDKFYFQHLSSEEMDMFVTMMNNGSINIGTPGYFYVLPFFAVKK